jgi:tetratricopeptide (TPR) repeat protein
MKDASAEDRDRALFDRGLAFGLLNQPQKAMNDYTRIIETKGAPDRQVSLALAGRGWVQYQLNNLTQALNDTQESFRRNPGNVNAAFNLGLILLRQERFAEAKSAYEKALKPGPQSGTIDDLVHLRDKLHGPAETTAFLGWLRVVSGQRNQGIKDLSQYLHEHADGPAAAFAKQWLTEATDPVRTEGAASRPADASR